MPEVGAGSFRALAETTEDLIVRLDTELRYLYINPACERALGRTLADVRGRTPEEIVDPAVARMIRSAVEQLRAGDPVATRRIEYARPDLALRQFEARFVAEGDPDGGIVAFLMFGRDVTAELRVAAVLEESEVRFQAVFENATVGMAVSSRQAHGYATNANSALARMLGYSRAELAQMHFSAFTHPDDVEMDVRLLAQVQAGQRDGYSIEKRLIRKDGTMFWGQLSVSAVRDADQNLRYVVGITEDITERKEIEAELRVSEERFRALVEHASDLIAILEPEGHIRYISPSQTRLLGYLPDEIRGMNAFELVHPDDRERVQARFADAMRVAHSLPAQRPIRFRRKDGAWCWLMVTTTDLRLNPAVGGIVANARDVTEELRLQERLTQAQKMEALGQLAGGVAHDFNNVLATIGGYAELLLNELPSSAPAADDVREIARATARGAGVTKQLLAFSRRQTLETEVLDLGSVVRETAGMLRALLPATIDLPIDVPAGEAVAVRAARAQVEQILMNLAVNARDAMPAGGRLAIHLDTREGPAGTEAVLTVSDSGHGMTEEIRSRAFEPFFTTKPKGQGTGLGLATVYGLVHQFGGRVELESAPGEGTTFRITLPVAGAARPAREETPPSPPAITGNGARLLVAEDEPQLRVVMRRALEAAGYEVTAVPDGAAALAAIHASRDFDLLISDVAMPRLGGRELAVAVEAGFAGLPMVLMSGYAELGATPDAVRDMPPNVVAFIEKPFEIDRLLTIVGDAVAGRPGARPWSGSTG